MKAFTLAEKYAKLSILNYPRTYSSAEDVFSFALFVIGTGIEWTSEGTLTSDFKYRTEKTAIKHFFDDLDKPDDDRMAQHRDKPFMKDFFDLEDERKHYQRAKRKVMLEHINAISRHNLFTKIDTISLMSLCKYSLIFTFPDNIEPSFRLIVSSYLRDLSKFFDIGGARCNLDAETVKLIEDAQKRSLPKYRPEAVKAVLEVLKKPS